MKRKRKRKPLSQFQRIQAWLARERRKQIRAREKGEHYEGFVVAKHAKQIDPDVFKRPLNFSRARVPVKRRKEGDKR